MLRPIRVVLRNPLTLCLLPLLTTTLFAQGVTGTISGRVYDSATGKSLQGAIVKVAGSTAYDYTDADGTFDLGGMAPGTYTVEIEFVGLDPFKQPVTVSAGGTASLDAALKSNILKLDAFQVTESVQGQALAVNRQKTAQGIVNIVSEETFGAMVDGNLGFALQRLPGLTVDDDADGGVSGVNIRGVSGEFNSFQIDGNRVPNSGVTSRSANTRQLLADGVTNIEVIKAPTPERDGDAVGGIVNVISRTAFQRGGRESKLNLGGTMNELARKWSCDGRGTWGYNVKAQYSDIFSVMGGEKNLGISFTASSYYTNRFYNNIDTDWERITVATNPQMQLPSPLEAGGGLPPFMSFLEASHSEYNIRSTNTYGFNGSIDFRIDQHNSFYFRPLYSHYNVTDGNDALKPLVSDNFDAQIEYYTQNGGLYSAGVFLKKIKNFTFNLQYRFDTVGQNDIPIPAPSGALLYTIPMNRGGAENMGVELIARQRLTFLPGPFKGFTASASATFTESEADYPNRPGETLPLPGFSDFIFTASLEYSWKKFHIRTDYRIRSDYIEGLDVDFSRDDWFGQREQVDAEITYRMRRNLSFFLTGQNLTERPLVSYQGYKYFVEDLSLSGRKYQFGVEYKF